MGTTHKLGLGTFCAFEKELEDCYMNRKFVSLTLFSLLTVVRSIFKQNENFCCFLPTFSIFFYANIFDLVNLFTIKSEP